MSPNLVHFKAHPRGFDGELKIGHKDELFGGKEKGLFDGRRRGEKAIGVQGLRRLDS